MTNRDRGAGATASYYLEKQTDLLPELDPKLQRLILEAREQDRRPGARTCNVHEDCGKLKVDVVAKLHKRNDTVEGFKIGRRIGQIATGEVAIEDIESVRRKVLSLKAATRVRPSLGISVPEIRGDAATLRNAFPDLDPALDGSGVIVGIVDTGCDFKHPNFLNADGTTRLLFLWDQREPREEDPFLKPIVPAPDKYPYGREFDREALNEALPTQRPYRTLAYRPETGAHGTHVMDIAAGNGREPRPAPPPGLDSRGVAPAAELIFVHVDTGDVLDPESLGNSRRLLEAVEYIFEKAEKAGKPAVVNVSLGTHGGPHDGSTPLEQGLDRLLRKPGRAIVIAAGNFYGEKAHAQLSVPPGQPVSLSWRIRPNDRTLNEMEIWYGGDTPLEVSLVFPKDEQTGNRQSLGPVLQAETHVIRRQEDDRMMGQIIHRENDPNNQDHQIDLLLDPGLPGGTWQVELMNRGNQPVEVHAWIERDDAPSFFTPAQATTSCTLASICCGSRTIAVGAYDSGNLQPMPFSSSGPTRKLKRRFKPDVSAPGQDVLAARARGGLMTAPGTSVAAPHVAGLVALLFQAAGPDPISNGTIKRALRGSVRRDPPGSPGHHARYGYGRIDAVAAVQAVRAPVPPGGDIDPEDQDDV